jgi:Staphylococcal nuclease homologue
MRRGILRSSWSWRFQAGTPSRRLPLNFGSTKRRERNSTCIFLFSNLATPNELHVFGTDRYGRLLAVIMLNGADVNLQQVRDGFAWVYEKYMGENTLDVQARYLSTEAEARQYRRGLWSDPHPIPPWSSEALDKFRREEIFRTSFVEGNFDSAFGGEGSKNQHAIYLPHPMKTPDSTRDSAGCSLQEGVVLLL